MSASELLFRLGDVTPLEFGLALPDLNGAQRFFEEARGSLAVRAFESDGVDLDFARGRDEDFEGAFHGYAPMRMSLMDPLRCGCRNTDSPLQRASRLALWTP